MDQLAAHRQPWLRPLTLLGLLVAFGLRLWQLGTESLWYDETVSVLLAGKPLAELLAHTARDIHPPGYYLLLHGWGLLVRPTPAHGLEFLWAYPSLGFGLLVVALTLALGRRLVEPRVALLALWLAALHPFQIWYSQEVRMYTVGACWGLVGLWALLQMGRGQRPLRWLLVAALALAAGLYTLYYFLFVFVALAGIALHQFWANRQLSGAHQRLGYWLAAQALALMLWTPWLPVFWRQVTEPPVPSWRVPWSSGVEFFHSLSEGLAALLIGQSLPGGVAWPWAWATVGVMALALWSSLVWSKGPVRWGADRQPAVGLLLLYVLLPLGLIFGLSLVGPPLYHVRYLFIAAPPFVLVLAVACAALWQRGLWGVAVLSGLLLCYGWSLSVFWYDPLYRSDDHRGAVALLADQWRPGDAILVNAGWVYPPLAVYWPSELTSPFDATPPPLTATLRLTADPTGFADPLLLRSGSIDGPSSLGWGDPASDFFASSTPATEAALAQVAAQAARLWHYRLYDTVSDPGGLIRNWLATHGELRLDQAFAGRDFLRLQLYEWPLTTPPPADPPRGPVFAKALALAGLLFAPETPAGRRLYVTATWRALSGLAEQPVDLAWSLRLYGANDALLAQADSSPFLPTSQWQPGTLYRTPLAIAVPAAAKPGEYRLALIVYEQASGQPVAVTGTGPATTTPSLGQVSVLPAVKPAAVDGVLATFDYLDLVAAGPAQQQIRVGEPLPVNLVWRPRPNAYTDTYLARLALVTDQDEPVATWEEALGGWEYPSGGWPPGWPVLDQKLLPTAGVAPGRYRLTLAVVRASDDQTIEARRGWLGRALTNWEIGKVTLAEP